MAAPCGLHGIGRHSAAGVLGGVVSARSGRPDVVLRNLLILVVVRSDPVVCLLLDACCSVGRDKNKTFVSTDLSFHNSDFSSGLTNTRQVLSNESKGNLSDLP